LSETLFPPRRVQWGMNLTLLIMLPMLLVLAVLTYTVLRTIIRAWLNHRVKMAILEKLETQPEALDNVPALQALVEDGELRSVEDQRQNLILTGAFLAAIGVFCALLAHVYLTGRYATGVYFGGVACVPIGFVLVLAGVLIRMLNRGVPVEKQGS